MDTDELIKKYGNRYAFEWFVRAEDQAYFRRVKEYIDRKIKKAAALVVASTALVVWVISLYAAKVRFR